MVSAGTAPPTPRTLHRPGGGWGRPGDTPRSLFLCPLPAGVRNHLAKNIMRSMHKGELAFYYHSSCAVPGIVGVVEVRVAARTGGGGRVLVLRTRAPPPAPPDAAPAGRSRRPVAGTAAPTLAARCQHAGRRWPGRRIPTTPPGLPATSIMTQRRTRTTPHGTWWGAADPTRPRTRRATAIHTSMPAQRCPALLLALLEEGWPDKGLSHAAARAPRVAPAAAPPSLKMAPACGATLALPRWTCGWCGSWNARSPWRS